MQVLSQKLNKYIPKNLGKKFYKFFLCLKVRWYLYDGRRGPDHGPRLGDKLFNIFYKVSVTFVLAQRFCRQAG